MLHILYDSENASACCVRQEKVHVLHLCMCVGGGGVAVWNEWRLANVEQCRCELLQEFRHACSDLAERKAVARARQSYTERRGACIKMLFV